MLQIVVTFAAILAVAAGAPKPIVPVAYSAPVVAAHSPYLSAYSAVPAVVSPYSAGLVSPYGAPVAYSAHQPVAYLG